MCDDKITMAENFLESSYTNCGFRINCQRLFFLRGATVLTSTSCCTSSHSILHEVSVLITQNLLITSMNFQML